MLVLSRRMGEEIVVAKNIVVRVIAINGGAVRLGIEAPQDVSVDRREIHDLREALGETERIRNKPLRVT